MIKAAAIVVMLTTAGCGSVVHPSMPTSIREVAEAATAHPENSTAVLTVSVFTATGWYDGERFHYWPRLTLTERGSVSSAWITTMVFELVDGGPAGRVPPFSGSLHVPAGGEIALFQDKYSDAWLEITSDMVNAAKVSVVISYIDDLGRGGWATAIADVSR